MRMIQIYEGNYDIEAEKLQHYQAFYNLVDGLKKLPYVYRLHYTVTVCVWFLVIKICTRIIFSFFFPIWVFQIRCSYWYYTLTIPVWGPILNNTHMVSKKTYDYWPPYQNGDTRTHMVIFARISNSIYMIPPWYNTHSSILLCLKPTAKLVDFSTRNLFHNLPN